MSCEGQRFKGLFRGGGDDFGAYGEGDVAVFHALSDQISSISRHVGILNSKSQHTSTTIRVTTAKMYEPVCRIRASLHPWRPYLPFES